MNIHKPLINVIIPVYNCEKFLDRCLQSIEMQTFKDWQAICVDDGSTDNSGKLLDEWGKKDTRFVIIHQANGGVSKARNTALDKAIAPYITMVDADDMLEPDALKFQYEAMQKHQVDIVTYEATRITDTKTFSMHISKEDKIVDINKEPLFRYFTSAACAKLYKNDIIKKWHIRYPEGIKMGEDYIFNICYWCHVRYAYVTPKLLYRYYDSETSVCKKFNLGLLPVEIYQTTLQITGIAYEKIQHDSDFIKNKKRWVDALFRGYMSRERWVFRSTKNAKKYHSILKITKRECRARLMKDMSFLCALKILFRSYYLSCKAEIILLVKKLTKAQ